jgi:hypothetical protein
MTVAEALNKSLFWDVDPSQLSWKKHKEIIIERVFQRGMTSDVKSVLKYYSKEDIIEVVTKSRTGFDKKTIHYLTRLLNIPWNTINAAPEYY